MKLHQTSPDNSKRILGLSGKKCNSFWISRSLLCKREGHAQPVQCLTGKSVCWSGHDKNEKQRLRFFLIRKCGLQDTIARSTWVQSFLHQSLLHFWPNLLFMTSSNPHAWNKVNELEVCVCVLKWGLAYSELKDCPGRTLILSRGFFNGPSMWSPCQHNRPVVSTFLPSVHVWSASWANHTRLSHLASEHLIKCKHSIQFILSPQNLRLYGKESYPSCKRPSLFESKLATIRADVMSWREMLKDAESTNRFESWLCRNLGCGAKSAFSRLQGIFHLGMKKLSYDAA